MNRYGDVYDALKRQTVCTYSNGTDFSKYGTSVLHGS